MTKHILLMIGFLICAAVGPSWAGTMTASPEQSSVLFRINHDLGYTVGYFKDFAATVEFGDDQKQVLGAKAQVQTGSINTRNAVRDEGLKSGLFLDSGAFPQATFESTKVDGDQMSGTLTVKGVAKPVTFKIEQDASGKIILRGSFDRNDFGIKYNSVMANKKKSIGNTIELIVVLKA